MKERINHKMSTTLFQIKSRAQVSLQRQVTHHVIAEMAGVSKRSVDEWMRGAVIPSGDCILQLLSQLNNEDVKAVIEFWRSDGEQHVAVGSSAYIGE